MSLLMVAGWAMKSPGLMRIKCKIRVPDGFCDNQGIWFMCSRKMRKEEWKRGKIYASLKLSREKVYKRRVRWQNGNVVLF